MTKKRQPKNCTLTILVKDGERILLIESPKPPAK